MILQLECSFFELVLVLLLITLLTVTQNISSLQHIFASTLFTTSPIVIFSCFFNYLLISVGRSIFLASLFALNYSKTAPRIISSFTSSQSFLSSLLLSRPMFAASIGVDDTLICSSYSVPINFLLGSNVHLSSNIARQVQSYVLKNQKNNHIHH